MFASTLPWWHFVVRALVVYLALLALVRISGKRTVGQFTPFDLLVVMLLSESVSNALSGGDESLTGGLIGAATLVGLNVATAYLSARSRAAEEWIEGRPVLIARNGELFAETLSRHRLGQGAWEEALREKDCRMEDVEMAFLESDGEISIVTRDRR